MLKFRSMRPDAERLTGVVVASKDDPRITKVGKILRKTRLDELPQFLNVLLGHMSIVGPRPERTELAEQLAMAIPYFEERMRDVKPGITGLAQINHHYDRCIDDVKTKVSYDLQYIERQGVLEDIKIMLQTIPVMLFRRGGW